MNEQPDRKPWVASTDDAVDIAKLLHAFNVEFDTPTPGVDALSRRLRDLLAGEATFAILAG